MQQIEMGQGNQNEHQGGQKDWVNDDEGKILHIQNRKSPGGHSGEMAFSDVCVHSLIETIEFVLGCISNTASYLRLWALSLAHGQLSKVFFERLLMDGVKEASIAHIFLAFPIWATVSFVVLMVMDLLECTLHTLRLHWVEFQNKFF